MVAPAGKVEDPKLEAILTQCSIAFGQGSGKIPISDDGIKELHRAYRRIVIHHAKNWEEGSDRILEYAQTIGRMSAHIAIGKGKLKIDSKSISEATRLLVPTIRCLKPLASKKAKPKR